MINFKLKSCLALITILLCNSCGPSEFNGSLLEIERFEFMDVYTGNGKAEEGNRLLYKAYLVHGYNKKYEQEIGSFLDSFVCDSILPSLQFDYKIFLSFFKASKNTNREKFKGRIKNKLIYAKTNDYLYFYSIGKYSHDTIVSMYKQKIAPNGELNPPSQDFYCK